MTGFQENKFMREKDLVERLLRRLGFNWRTPSNPNAAGDETGIDVLVPLDDDRIFGVQVTMLDPHSMPGKARAKEKQSAGKTPAVYGGWAQNDPKVYLKSLVRAIKRKIAIVERHSFEGLGLTEVWLLVCSGIPEHGAIVSTILMTPWLREHDIEIATGGALQNSKYDRCFYLPIIAPEEAFYRWQKHSKWKKTVVLEDIREIPREAYVRSLFAAHDDQERDRLCEEEAYAVLRELRETKQT
jgi:hypothetical protein